MKKLILFSIVIFITNIQSSFVQTLSFEETLNYSELFEKTMNSIEESILMINLKLDMKVFQKHYYKEHISNEIVESVVKYSKIYNLDPYVVLAMIKTESSCKPNATSKFGARGLMQVMWTIWGEKLIENKICETKDELYNIDTGIAAGCYVLSHYLDRTNCIKSALQRYFGKSNYAKKYSRIVLART